MLRAVGGHDNAVAFFCQTGYDLHEKLLICVVQVCRRFVHYKDLCGLADSAGDEYQLALAAAEGGIGLIYKLQGIYRFKRLKGGFTVYSLWGVKSGEMEARPISTTSRAV